MSDVRTEGETTVSDARLTYEAEELVTELVEVLDEVSGVRIEGYCDAIWLHTTADVRRWLEEVASEHVVTALTKAERRGAERGWNFGVGEGVRFAEQLVLNPHATAPVNPYRTGADQ